MSSLYLDRKNLGIRLDGQTLALYEDGVKKGTVPLHLLERVVLRGNVQLESRNAISACWYCQAAIRKPRQCWQQSLMVIQQGDWGSIK
jgi:hypothetical protein